MAEATQITNRGQGYLDGLRDRGGPSEDTSEKWRFVLLSYLEEGPLTRNTFSQLLLGGPTGPFDRWAERRALDEILVQLHRLGYIEFTEVDV